MSSGGRRPHHQAAAHQHDRHGRRVETGEHAVLLTSYGCAQAQGHLFYRALAPEKIRQLLAAERRIDEWQERAVPVAPPIP